MRHPVFDQWLIEERHIDHVMQHMADANFDPEFYSRYESQIITAYNHHSGTSLHAKKANPKRIFNLSQTP